MFKSHHDYRQLLIEQREALNVLAINTMLKIDLFKINLLPMDSVQIDLAPL